MGEEAVARVVGVVTGGDPPVTPTPATAPETVGEVRRRRASGAKGKRREWFLKGKGERGGR